MYQSNSGNSLDLNMETMENAKQSLHSYAGAEAYSHMGIRNTCRCFAFWDSVILNNMDYIFC